MKKILLIFSFLFSIAYGQIVYTPMAAAGYQYKYVKIDSGIAVPLIDTSIGRGTNRPGSIVCRPQDSLFYGWNGDHWAVMGADVASLVALINTKVDSVTINGDSLFYWKNGVNYGYFFTSDAWKLRGNSPITGDYFGSNNAYPVFVKANGDNVGFFSDSLVTFGDIFGATNKTKIDISDRDSSISLHSHGIVTIGDDFGVRNSTLLQVNDTRKSIFLLSDTINAPQLSSSSDTITYKPLSINSSGNIKKFDNWGSVPSQGFQSVLDIDNVLSRTDTVLINGDHLYFKNNKLIADNLTSLGDFTIGDNTQSGTFNWYMNGLQSSLGNNSWDTARTWLMPKQSGILPISVNHNFADSAGNINISASPTPNLQQVTDVGNTTTNELYIYNALNIKDNNGSGVYDGVLRVIDLTDNRNIYLPDASGTIPLSVNGNFANSLGDITVSGLSSLQQVTDVGDTTNHTLTISKDVDNIGINIKGLFDGQTKLDMGNSIDNAGYLNIHNSSDAETIGFDGQTGTITASNATLNSLVSGSSTDSVMVINNATGIVHKRNASAFTTDTTSLSNRINLKLNISDTSSMLTSYRNAINTNTAAIATKGSGTVTSIATGLGLSGGTITTTGTLLVDTSNISILSRQRAASTYQPILTATLPLSISSNILSMPKASATDSGWVSTGTQTIAGAKTFSGNTTISGTATISTLASGASTDSIVTVVGSTGLLKKRSVTDLLGTGVWQTIGNAGTVTNTNFIGTTDNHGLDFRTNNTLRARLDSNGCWNFGGTFSTTSIAGTVLRARAGTDQNLIITSYNSAPTIGAYNDAFNSIVTLGIRGTDVRLYANTVEMQRIYGGGTVLMNNGATYPTLTNFSQTNFIANTSTNTTTTSLGVNDYGVQLVNTATATAGNFSTIAFGNNQTVQSTIIGQNVGTTLTSGGRLIFSTRIAGGSITEAIRITETQNLLVGTTTDVPSSALTVASSGNNKGFLPPKLTTTQRDAISSPAEGLIIYNLTTHKLNVYTGSAWEVVTSL